MSAGAKRWASATTVYRCVPSPDVVVHAFVPCPVGTPVTIAPTADIDALVRLLRSAPVGLAVASRSTVVRWEQERAALLATIDKENGHGRV